ncbi:carbohydrate kinase [Streptomyces lincolnensis]|uniref:Carbohydrate kinase n=1 Tax=Streptomyces lincolnensis TaxID=1915 RepID=A0A1B1MGA6_STRLN|nr:sugar kinase [Streptomyces lincolnensis]ANS67594.1 carbohydrate kinase [Streptomyces lincolnensis]AXG54909.1 carbohydrate kinase [Streptomyces lincolnensis]QMV09259.1 sugar kinase [Streptomyces lincolnensis]
MTVTGPCNAPDVVDVVALGESMVTFLPSRPGRLADVPSFERGIGGAESNVACGLAAAGHTVRWVSRVGGDGFGDHLVETIGGWGVDVTSVRRDPKRPTGLYFRTAGDRATDAHEVAYYRAGSAASAMSVENLDMAAVRAGRVVHLSGITAALSADCLDLLRALTASRPERPLVSFDVNHRAGLWRDAEGPRVLLDLARGADIVFVGEDEAEEAWGVTGGPAAIREMLPEPSVVVVKQGARGATAFTGVPPAFVPALHVTPVAAVGAGDAFAAGFLSATLRGLPLKDRLRHGHLHAAATLTAPGDLAPPPARDHADRLAALDDTAWGRLRLGPGWTAAAHRAEEEVHTP